MFDAQGLRGLTDEHKAFLASHASLRTLKAGDFLVREGEPSTRVFVVKSGLLGVLLEAPAGPLRLVRCCYPGWLLGESSVLATPREGQPHCTASLRAERPTEVWAIDAAVLSSVMAMNDALRMRIAATKHIHRIDSFFSMHETLGPLDVGVRDDLLGCLHSIEIVDEDDTLFEVGEVPSEACLIARGEVELFSGPSPSKSAPGVAPVPRATLGSDQFVGMRDTIHRIGASLSAVAKKGSMLVLFDADRLRNLAERSPPEVVAALERLG